MASEPAKTGEVIDVRPLGAQLQTAKTTTLLETDGLKVVRLVVPAGKEIPSHRAPGEITVQCLEGRVVFRAGATDHELAAGQLLHLAAHEEHALRGVADASLLVTIVLR
jgi:quercetin dioxygenase-like cupin family protein